MKYDQIDKAPEEKERGITISTAHVEYETEKASLCSCGLSRSCGLCKKYDYRSGPNGWGDSCGFCNRWPYASNQRAYFVGSSSRSSAIVVFLNKCDQVDDKELLELVELEIRELLTAYKFPGNEIPIIKGSALKALEGDGENEKVIQELMTKVDEYIPCPKRDVDKPFLMPVEDVFSISGRGTVATGRIERGIIKIGTEVEIVGLRETKKTVVTGIEMFRKQLEEGRAGDNAGLLLRGIEKNRY